MFFEKDELVKVGEVVRTHGFNGNLSIKVHSDFSEEIFNEDLPVFLIIEGIPVPFFIVSTKKSGSYIVVELKNVDSEKKAQRLIACDLLIHKSFIEVDEEEIEDNILQGYSVFDSKHGFIGKFTFINEIPGNPVFETDFNGKTIIIPYSDEFINEINDITKEIHITAPDGLIDLYLV
jgi:16S rRNA processing protein RimM